ncbi:MAG: polysaccharide export protein [Candidatus Omnitrophica bacterium]|nr:polysaccharide export protein [Candidatus Omnitrophota bacterium]
MKGKVIIRIWEKGLIIAGIMMLTAPVWAQDADLDAQAEVKKPVSNIEQPVKKAVKKNPNAIQKEQYGEYTLGQNDIIDINVRRHTEFSGRFPIGTNGRIQYPFVGDIELNGLTKSAAVEKVKDVLSQYIEAPEVDITIVEYNSKVVYVIGQVARPGRYSMHAEFMPVRDAVLAADLPRENTASLRRAVIIRPLENGKTVVKKVNMLSLLYDGNLKLNYDLHSGDIVYLPSTALYKVSTILQQIVSPVYTGASTYNTYYDTMDARDRYNNRND